jgi:hypothetical protein
LDGVRLVRVHDLGKDKNNIPISGRFDTANDVLRIADEAFAYDDREFSGGERGVASFSSLTILHEIGHAVETKKVRESIRALKQSRHDSIAAMTAAQNAYEKAYGAATSKVVNHVMTHPNHDLTKGQSDYNSAYDAVSVVLDNYCTAVGQGSVETFATADEQTHRTADKEKYANLLGEALAKIELQEKATLPADRAGRPDPFIGYFKDVNSFTDGYLSAVRQAAEINSELAAMYVAKKGKDKQGNDTLTLSHVNSRRLQNFMAYVNQCKVPKVTEYATTSAQEFYAEAYSLWLNDPEYLETNARVLFNWFKGKCHLDERDLTAMKCIP